MDIQERGGHCVRFPTNLVPENSTYRTSLLFAFENSIRTGSGPNALSERNVSGSQRPRAFVEDSENKSCANNDENSSGIADLVLEAARITEKIET